MKTFFLYNPRAGRAPAQGAASLLEGRSHWGEVRCRALTARSCAEEFEEGDRVLVMGGDGSVNGILPHLMGRNIELNFLPAGSANDLGAALGLRGNAREILESLEGGRTVPYDVITVNGRPVITGGGFGLGCLAAESANTLRTGARRFLFRPLRGGIYLLTLGWHGLFSPPPRMGYRLSADGFLSTGTTQSLLFCNQAVMGKNVVVAPGTVGDDGRFQFVRFLNGNSQGILRTLLQLRAGSLRAGKMLDRAEVRRVEIEFDQPVSAYGDGEIFAAQARWELECLPGAIQLRVPAGFGTVRGIVA